MAHELLQAISDLMDKKLEPVFTKLDVVDKRLDAMDERLNGIDTRLDGVDERLDSMDKRFDSIDQRMDALKYMQQRTAKKLDDFQLDIRVIIRDMKNDIHTLHDQTDTVIELLKIHQIINI